ncbi:MAG: hypothetical protein IKH26_12160 [Bacteroidaceae bacterium]|nr:hypothetical protein [Bacteroidaceae bacterium]
MTNLNSNEMIVVPEMVNRLKQTDFDCVIYRGIVSDGSCLAIHDYSFRELSALEMNGGSVPLPSAWNVMEWLRQRHGYHLSLTFDRKGEQWCWCIYRLWSLGHCKAEERMLKNPILVQTCEQGFNTWHEACKAGIEATLEMVSA